MKTEGEKKEKRGQRGLGSLDQHRRHWRLDITIHGKRHRIVIGLVKLLDKREARKIADERVRELMTRPEPVEQKGTMPFSEFAKKFLAWKAETNVTWRRYKGKPLDETPLKRAAAFFGDTPLKDITRGSVEQGFRVGLQMESFSGRKLKNRTVNGAVHLLRHVFYKAMEWGEAIANPAAEIEGLDEERQRPPARTIDTDEEQAKLVAELPGWLRSMVEFNLQTGARRGDLLQLTWESVHLDTGYVEFAQTKECRHRKIPLSDRAKAILKFLRPNEPSKGEFVFEPGVERKTLVSRITREWRGAWRRAGVPKIRFHDLRHTTATRLIRRDADVRTVQDILGHAKLSTTERYLHTNDKLKQAAVAKLGPEIGTVNPPAPEPDAAEKRLTYNRIKQRARSSVG